MITLPSSLLIYDVAEVKEELSTAVEGEGQDVVLDAHDLADIDAAGLQLLSSLAQECKDAGQKMEIVNANTRIRDAFVLFGDRSLILKEAVDEL